METIHPSELPQLSGEPFLTDGGLETTLILHRGIDLPAFAALDPGEPWVQRIRALRANASTLSHGELDEAEELDAGDPADLGARYTALRERLPNLNVVGGCCGTDDRHVARICAAWLQPAA